MLDSIQEKITQAGFDDRGYNAGWVRIGVSDEDLKKNRVILGELLKMAYKNSN